MSTPLAECPFCGGKPGEPRPLSSTMQLADGSIVGKWSVFCPNQYNKCMGQGPIEPSPTEAIDAWNTRASRPSVKERIEGHNLTPEQQLDRKNFLRSNALNQTTLQVEGEDAAAKVAGALEILRELEATLRSSGANIPIREGTSKVSRANYLGAPQAFELNQACVIIRRAFPEGGVYLVGSCLEKRDYRDVDLRCILPDDEFEKMFPGIDGEGGAWQYNGRWSLMCSAISHWLQQKTGLPIDFQFQAQTRANELYKGMRHAQGIFLDPPISTDTEVKP